MRMLSFFGLVCAALGAAVANPGMAVAGSRYYHPSMCQVAAGTATFNTSGQVGNATGGSLTLWCPLVIDPTVGLPNANTSVSVDVFMNSVSNNNDERVEFQVCSVFAGGGGQQCAPSIGLYGGPGVTHPLVGVPNVVPGDHVYLTVILRKILSGSTNTFFGYSLNEY